MIRVLPLLIEANFVWLWRNRIYGPISTLFFGLWAIAMLIQPHNRLVVYYMAPIAFFLVLIDTARLFARGFAPRTGWW